MVFKEDENGNLLDGNGNRLCHNCHDILEIGDDMFCCLCSMR